MLKTHVCTVTVACLLIAAQAAAQDVAFVATVPIRDSLSDEMAEFIALQGQRTEVERTSGAVMDLVRESCGHWSPNNVQVFGRAILAQGGTLDPEGGFRVDAPTTWVPPCLPDETEGQIVGRLPTQGDAWARYYLKDTGRPYSTQGWGEIAPSALDIQFPATGREIDAEPPVQSSPGPQTPNLDLQQVFDRLAASGADPADRSRIAYEAFAVTGSLLAAGHDRRTRRWARYAAGWSS